MMEILWIALVALGVLLILHGFYREFWPDISGANQEIRPPDPANLDARGGIYSHAAIVLLAEDAEAENRTPRSPSAAGLWGR